MIIASVGRSFGAFRQPQDDSVVALRLTSRFLLMQLPKRLGISREQLRPIDHIGAVACPVLIMSGADDRNTTREDTALLFAQAHEPKQLWLVEKAGHVDLHSAAPAEYEQRVLAFFSDKAPE